MKSWIAMAFGGENNPYGDVPTESYAYDDKVQNHKQVAVGDLLYVRGHGSLEGIGRVARIDQDQASKQFEKCPTCRTGRMHERVGMRPRFKCKDGHEFDKPLVVSQNVKTFNASFGGQWLDVGRAITVMELRPFELRDSKQLALMPADGEGLAQYIARRRPVLAKQLMGWLGDVETRLADDDADASIDLTPSEADERRRIMRSIRQRRGQANFRDDLIERYGGCCVVTGSRVLGVLEAAHVRPYRGPRDNHPANGLLLRSDIHTLFDLDRIAIDPDTLVLWLDEELRETEYAFLHGKRLFESGLSPNKTCLRMRWAQFLAARDQSR